MSLTAPLKTNNGGGSPSGSVLDSLQEFGVQALSELDQVLATREHLAAEYKAKLAEIDGHVVRLRRFIRNCGLEDPTTGRRAGKQKQPTGAYAKVTSDPKKLAKIVEAIESYPEGAQFTVLEIHQGKLGSPWGDPETYKVFEHLRSIEYLARVGKHPETKRYIWKVLDREAASRLLSQPSNGAAKRSGAPKHANKPFDQVKAEAAGYIAEHSPVEGWVQICNTLGIPKHQVGRLRDQLEAEGQIRITEGRGNFKMIHWVGNAS